jgi:uncharacterized protein
MKALFRDFFSNESLFFNQFDLAAKNVAEMADILLRIVNTDCAEERETLFKQVDKRENAGDDITHKIYLSLNKALFTPLSRSDIHSLASGIDDVADAIHEAGGRIILYNIDEFSPAVKHIAEIILLASQEIENAVVLLRSFKSRDELAGLARQIKSYEKQSDKVYYKEISSLFSTEKNPVKLLKYREILLSLESAVNKCKGVTDVLDVIVINR